ncbi:MAG TPA: DNA replication/repair protein RecF [Allosphingosinicella sp.]|jgi:DNA replication and repair protein RecF|nr:DNA replication/repair protein RecF [Allosphingosinicella sp.]
MTALVRLSLTDFRSYADAVMAPGPGLVILTGENGAGKTNVLEAVSLLSPGRGLRGAALAEMARKGGSGGFAVAAKLSPSSSGEGLGWGSDGSDATERVSPDSPSPNPSPEGEGLVDIGTGTSPTAPERRQVRINGASASANSLAEWLSVLWLTPAMDRLFVEGAGGRRRFLDRLVLALVPGHAVHAARYEAAMRARNKLLGEPGPRDDSWLTALEARMAEHGVAIVEARRRTVDALRDKLAEAPEGPFARAGLALEGGEEDLAAALAAGRTRDAAAGRTLAGPHRTDLMVTHLTKDQPASLSSTGEQKALLLSIVLAHADLVAERAGRRPILLLDEVAAHLDPRRRAALFERLEAGGGQVWMTGTEPSLFEAARGDKWHVADGRLSRA